MGGDLFINQSYRGVFGIHTSYKRFYGYPIYGNVFKFSTYNNKNMAEIILIKTMKLFLSFTCYFGSGFIIIDQEMGGV